MGWILDWTKSLFLREKSFPFSFPRISTYFMIHIMCYLTFLASYILLHWFFLHATLVFTSVPSSTHFICLSVTPHTPLYHGEKYKSHPSLPTSLHISTLFIHAFSYQILDIEIVKVGKISGMDMASTRGLCKGMGEDDILVEKWQV